MTFSWTWHPLLANHEFRAAARSNCVLPSPLGTHLSKPSVHVKWNIVYRLHRRSQITLEDCPGCAAHQEKMLNNRYSLRLIMTTHLKAMSTYFH